MVQALSPVSAIWTAPSWATSEILDYGSIEYRSSIGEITPDAPEAPLVVDIVERHEFDLDAEPVTVMRSPAQVSVAGVWIRADQARDLARLLYSAAEVIDETGFLRD